MNGLMKRFLPVVVLGGFVVLTLLITANKPSSNRRTAPPVSHLSVETYTIKPQFYQVEIESFGTVQPRTQSQLVSQVSGQVIEISPNFRNGGFFNQGDVLVSIDPRDYDIAIETAAAELASAEVALLEEQARAQQARREWTSSANNSAATKATDFVLRKPQVAAAKAQVASASANLRQARLNRERTQIKAPYAGRILNKNVDVGQVVSQNTALADIYAIDFVEVRLPLQNSELNFIELPELNRFQSQALDERFDDNPDVFIHSDLGGTEQHWDGKLVRTAGAIDDQSHQLHVIAQIDDPYGEKMSGRLPLKIGQYVTATIKGRLLDDAIVVPNAAVYQGSYVYVVVKDNILERRNITIAWQNARDAIVSRGLGAGEQLVLTPLGQVSSGTPVRILPPAQLSVQQPPVQQTPIQQTPSEAQSPQQDATALQPTREKAIP